MDVNIAIYAAGFYGVPNNEYSTSSGLVSSQMMNLIAATSNTQVYPAKDIYDILNVVKNIKITQNVDIINIRLIGHSDGRSFILSEEQTATTCINESTLRDNADWTIRMIPLLNNRTILTLYACHSGSDITRVLANTLKITVKGLRYGLLVISRPCIKTGKIFMRLNKSDPRRQNHPENCATNQIFDLSSILEINESDMITVDRSSLRD